MPISKFPPLIFHVDPSYFNEATLETSNPPGLLDKSALFLKLLATFSVKELMSTIEDLMIFLFPRTIKSPLMINDPLALLYPYGSNVNSCGTLNTLLNNCPFMFKSFV